MKLFTFEGLDGGFCCSINAFTIAESAADAKKKLIQKYIRDVTPAFGIKNQKDKKYIDKKINDFKDSFNSALMNEFDLNENVCELIEIF